MKVLITGVGGLIASHLQDALIEQGHEVSGIDSLVGGFRRNINPKTTFLKDTLCNKKSVDLFMEVVKPEVVIHCAADATEGRSQFTPRSATENNIQASVNVFTSAVRHGVKRIIFTSSMSVYGKQTPPFDESLPTNPVDVYGVNKASTEKILSILADVHGVEYVIIRPHNVFGPRQNIRDAYRNVVGIFMNRVMKNEPPVIYGDGEQVRSFTYIDNIIPCLVKALDAPISGEIINVGPIETQTINHLAQTVIKTFGKTHLEPIHVLDRPLEVKTAHCTNEKAERLLGYKTLVSFEEGIERMAKWAQELGPQEMVYLDDLEIINEKVPNTWRNKTL